MNFGQLSWGKTNRLAQIFRPNKEGEFHTVMLAVDHPYFYGPTEGLVDPRETIQPLVPYADAISPAKGTLEYCLDPCVQGTLPTQPGMITRTLHHAPVVRIDPHLVPKTLNITIEAIIHQFAE